MEQAQAGNYGFKAIGKTLNDDLANVWLDEMIFDMIKTPYLKWNALDMRTMAPGVNKITINKKEDLDHSFAQTMLAGFAILYHPILFDPKVSLFDTEDKLAFKLEGDIHKRMQILRDTNTSFESLGNATYDASEEASRVVITDIKSRTEGVRTLIMPVITNTENIPPYTAETPVRLHYGRIRDYLNEPLPAWTSEASNIYVNSTPLVFPKFDCSGSFTSEDTGNLIVKESVITGGSIIKTVRMDLWGAAPNPVDLVITATPQADETTLDDNHFSIIGGVSYRVTQYKVGDLWTQWDEVNHWDSTNGRISLPSSLTDEPAYYVITVKYEMRHTIGSSYDTTDQYSHTIASFWLNHK